MKLSPNWVAIEFDREQYESQVAVLKSGMQIQKRFDKHNFATIFGVVKDVCEKLSYSDDKGDSSEAELEYDGEVEICKGDEVYFNYLSAEKAVNSGRIIDNSLIIRYDRLYAAFNGKRWKGVNGWKIVQPIALKQEIGAFVTEGEERGEGIVVGKGEKVKHYWDKRYEETGWLEVGDKVRFLHATPIENPVLKSKEIDLVRIQERDVLYRGDYEMNPYVFHVERKEVLKSEDFRVRDKIMCRGEILHSPNGESGEILYHKESEYTNCGETFITRIGSLVEIKGHKIAIPL